MWSPEPTDDVAVTQYKLVKEGGLEPEEIEVFAATEKSFEYQSIDAGGTYVLLAGDEAGNWTESGPKAKVWVNTGMNKPGIMPGGSGIRLNTGLQLR
jgi:hypothetical protein